MRLLCAIVEWSVPLLIPALTAVDRTAKRWLAWSDSVERRRLTCGCRPRVGMTVVRVTQDPSYPHKARDQRNPFLIGSRREITSLLEWGGRCGLIETQAAQQPVWHLSCDRHWRES